jgi:HAD superfamily hydrolase (TIGR01549 family)
MKDSLTTPQGILFDLDGTLIDTTAVYFKMVAIALDRLGLPAAPRERILAAAETDPFDWLRIIPPDYHHQREKLIPAAWRVIEEVYPALFRAEAALMSGAVDVLNRLVREGIKIGIVTSTPRNHLAHKMSLFDGIAIMAHLSAIIAADDAPRKKPAPDPLLACADLLGLPAATCLYIGDTWMDIRAGKAAGMMTVAVLSGFDQSPALAAEDPDALIESVGC